MEVMKMSKRKRNVYMVALTVEMTVPLFAKSAHEAAELARKIATEKLGEHGIITCLKTATGKTNWKEGDL